MTQILSIRNIFWRPTGTYSNEILKNISFDINKEDFLVLRGPARSGKTSLLDIMYGKISPSSGIAGFKNRNYEDISEKELACIRKEIAYCPENPVFIETATLFENLKFILKFKNIPEDIIFDKIIHILKLVGLISIRELTPEKLSSIEKKLFSLALEMVKEKEIFLCDFNLSSQNENRILDILTSIYHRGGTVIITAPKKANFNISGIKYIDLKDGQQIK